MAVPLSTPRLTEAGPLSATDHTLIVLAVTVARTLFGGLIASRLRHLMLQLVDKSLRKSVNRSNRIGNASNILSSLNMKWRGILEIDSISEKTHNLPIAMISLF
jgi:hypothetical protein